MSECTNASGLLGKAHQAYFRGYFSLTVQFLSIILLAYDSHMKRALWVASMQALPVSLILHFLSCTPPSTTLVCEHSHNLLFQSFSLSVDGAQVKGLLADLSSWALFMIPQPPTFNVYSSFCGLYFHGRCILRCVGFPFGCCSSFVSFLFFVFFCGFYFFPKRH